jgi:hypothetical protein
MSSSIQTIDDVTSVSETSTNMGLWAYRRSQKINVVFSILIKLTSLSYPFMRDFFCYNFLLIVYCYLETEWNELR